MISLLLLPFARKRTSFSRWCCWRSFSEILPCLARRSFEDLFSTKADEKLVLLPSLRVSRSVSYVRSLIYPKARPAILHKFRASRLKTYHHSQESQILFFFLIEIVSWSYRDVFDGRAKYRPRNIVPHSYT